MSPTQTLRHAMAPGSGTRQARRDERAATNVSANRRSLAADSGGVEADGGQENACARVRSLGCLARVISVGTGHVGEPGEVQEHIRRTRHF